MRIPFFQGSWTEQMTEFLVNHWRDCETDEIFLDNVVASMPMIIRSWNCDEKISTVDRMLWVVEKDTACGLSMARFLCRPMSHQSCYEWKVVEGTPMFEDNAIAIASVAEDTIRVLCGAESQRFRVLTYLNDNGYDLIKADTDILTKVVKVPRCT